MRLPVTFKQTNLDQLIRQWKANNYQGSEIYYKNNSDAIEEARRTNGTFVPFEEYYYFYHSTWYGFVIDTLVTVHDCVQVFRARTVTMQS